MLLCEPIDDQISRLCASHCRQNQEKLLDNVSCIAFENASFKAVNRIKRTADRSYQSPDLKVGLQGL